MESKEQYLATQSDAALWQPVMSTQNMVDRQQRMAHIVREMMVSGQHYGVVPGTGTKPTLLKPGAEMLSTFFGLQKSFEFIERTEDWAGADHDGEPFFYYLVRCNLARNGLIIASGDGSCNSWERKYRYRRGERQCPNCGQAAIIKGKDEYGGGWLCFARRGGCGTKFKDGDAAIESQTTGAVINPDIFDQVNTILKMAEKRALVAAVLLAVGASDFFTQDMEDIIDGEWAERQPEPPAKAQPVHEAKSTNGHGRPWSPEKLREVILFRVGQHRSQGDAWTAPPTSKMRAEMVGLLNQILDGEDRRHEFMKFVYGEPFSGKLDNAQVTTIMEWLNGEAGPDIVEQEARLAVEVEARQSALVEFDEVDGPQG